MEINVLHLGLDAFHLTCARAASPEGQLVITRSSSESVHMGAYGVRGHPEGESLWASPLRAVRRLVELARASAPEGEFVAIASEALRDVPESACFFDILWHAHALRPRLLTENAETCLTYVGATKQRGTHAGQTAVIDVGSRSIRFAVGSHTGCLATASAPLGIERLRDAFGHVKPQDIPAVAAVLRLSAGPAVKAMRQLFPEHVVMTSTFASAVRHIACAWGFMDQNETALCRVGLHALAASVAKTSARELRRLDVQPARAMHLVISAVVLDTVADLFQTSEITFADWGVSEGLALRQLRPGACRNQPVLHAARNFSVS